MTDDDASDDREILTWDGFGAATRALSRAIVDDGFAPDVVVAIARGGLLPAGAIAYGLGVKSCGALNVEFYTGIGAVLDAPALLPPDLDLGYLPGKRVLLVDDVADSGRTLALAVTMLTDAGAEVRSVCIYTKPGSVASPDFSWRETDRWIDFPWSARGTVFEEEAGADSHTGASA
ncbi:MULTISPECIES: phosphoribosyltransferase [Microbacterium]|uniref:phosphoribosyltransferase n=1 Tax=Microbacterium TaxID=33882 RepID=UPI0018B04D81|nr:phosphoribosyltransferase [Microbacterium sp. F2E]MBF9336870.1 phosphoribosyltransferase [Microbacterium lacticum]MCC9053707.1 phosphoribosyltransferase [Microbacterium sp. F2E]